ncbi:uncharacterized protein RBU33_015948, partial [Hipposideros larvatus]
RVDGAAAAAAEECPSSPVSGGSPPSSPAPDPFEEPQGASAAYSPEAGVSCPRSHEGAQSLGEKSTSASRAAPPTQAPPRDRLTRKAKMLLEFLLEKYKTNERITRSEMIKVVGRKDKEQLPEILRRASERLEVVFGLELKEVDPSNDSYALINMLDLPSEGSLSGERGLPKTGLLMTILGVIFMKGNRATEEGIWECLNELGFYAGRKHALFGEPRQLMTKDFVQLNYLEYRQVPDSDPPRYEFLWGPRAKAETTKMKVLEIIAKINDTVPSAFPNLYEEALRDEEERAAVRSAARAARMAEASVPSKAKSHSSSHGREETEHETESLRVDGAAAAAAEECPSSPVSGGSPPSSPAPDPFEEPQGASAAYSPEAGVSCPRSHEGAQSLGEKSTSASRAAPPTQAPPRDRLTRKAKMLLEFLLEKYKTNERITRSEMIKVVGRKDKEQLPEILRRASERLEVVFGLELKEVDPSNDSYALINMLDLPSEGSLSGERGLPKTGLLMTILGVIFMKGNRATEEGIWECLNELGFYAGRKHALFGEPRQLMTKDFVQLNYLEYRQVPDSDPPRYEFLWGPRAKAETTKMKVLEIIAKINDTVPSAFPNLYEEALRDEEERAAVRSAARAARMAEASAPSKAKSHRSSHGREETEHETESLRVDGAAAAAAEECPSSPVSGGSPPSSPAPDPFEEPQGASAAYSPEAGVSCPRSHEGAQSLGEKSTSASRAAPPTQAPPRDRLTRKAKMLLEFLLEKYKTNERITRSEMIKVVGRKDKEQLPEILRRASERLEVVFGLELKEVDPSNDSYALINMLDLPSEGSLSGERGLPKTGLLMTILGVIFMKGNRATEEGIWECLNELGFYAGRKHALFGEPRQLMTKDFVQLNYLEYRQVPDSDPPRYEFLWGPRAKAETTKMKVLEIIAKINDTVPSAFPNLYEEALRDEEERAAVRSAARAARMAEASVPSKAKSHSSSHAPPRDRLTRKAKMLLEFLLEKYKTNERITRSEMIKVVGRKDKEQLPEILRRASERLEVVFGLELKEVDPSNDSYALINMLDLPSEGSLSGERGLPKTGLLMTILGVIFMKGNRATEEGIWECLNELGFYAGRKHALFGEPRQLMTKDFVQLNYLEYRQVPDSDPPRYEFLWGPRAKAETTKMKVLEIIAKINDTVPSAFPNLYEEALRDEEERAAVRSAARAARMAEASVPSKAKSHSSSHAPPRDRLTRKAKMLLEFLLEKYKTNERITRSEMIKVVGRKDKEQLPEILRRASERLEVVFGLELKEVDPSNDSYALINMLDLPSEGSLSGERGLPKTGLLMTILGVIFMKGNRATEEGIWECLNELGFYAGRKHALFGEPRQLMTKDFVQLNYLEYRQVPDSDPPRYEFLWGPRAKAETTKMKVLEIIAKINDTVPSAFPNLYEEALRDEEERAAVRSAARAARMAEASVPSKAKSHSSSHAPPRDRLTRKAKMLLEFLLEKYKTNERITRSEMIKVVGRKDKEQLPEILRRASERLEVVFGLELKEVDPSNDSYALINMLDLPSEGSLSGERGLPKTGLLMTILGVIFMKGNRATEEGIWECLNELGFYAGRKHALFGEPRQLMTKDFVQLNYLEYRQVPDSDPPRYEFLWGPRAKAETTKMKVLEIIAKINDTVPSAFPNLYEEALRDEEERAAVRSAARAARMAEASVPSKAKSHSSSHV